MVKSEHGVSEDSYHETSGKETSAEVAKSLSDSILDNWVKEMHLRSLERSEHGFLSVLVHAVGKESQTSSSHPCKPHA